MVDRRYPSSKLLEFGCLVVLLILGNRQGQAGAPSAVSLTVAVVSPRCLFGDVEARIAPLLEAMVKFLKEE